MHLKKSVPNLSDRRSFPESGAAATFRKRMKKSNFRFFLLKSLRIDSFSLMVRLFEKLEVESKLSNPTKLVRFGTQYIFILYIFLFKRLPRLGPTSQSSAVP